MVGNPEDTFSHGMADLYETTVQGTHIITGLGQFKYLFLFLFYAITADTGSYQCHSWTYEDKAKFLLNCTYHNELERPTCESHPGFVYTQGNDTLAPGCTSCFCCKPTGKLTLANIMIRRSGYI